MGKELVAVSKVGGEVARCAEIVAAEMEAIRDEQTARQCVDDMGLLEAVLRRVHAYEEKAREYLTMECLMWFRIAEVCGKSTWQWRETFKAHERRLIEWVNTKGEKQRRKIVRRCATGIGVRAQMNEQRRMERAAAKAREDAQREVWKAEREAQEAEHKREAIERREKAKSDACMRLMEKFSDSGVVRCNRGSFDMAASSQDLTANEVRHMVEDTRDMLLQAGAVGLGDGDGTYIDPKAADYIDVKRAINQRVRGVANDIKSITKLVEMHDAYIWGNEMAELQWAYERLVEAVKRREAAA